MLVEFQSVVDAVCCAVEVQREMSERNVDTPPEQRIEFRIGINLGDVICRGTRHLRRRFKHRGAPGSARRARWDLWCSVLRDPTMVAKLGWPPVPPHPCCTAHSRCSLPPPPSELAPRSAGRNAEPFCSKTTASLGFRPNEEHRELLLSGSRLATSEAR
jgi:hypothetical protein